jgi:large subunit ribosomal protein L21
MESVGVFHMYAVIFSGGKQYRVQEGETLKLESLPEEVGSTVNFDKILLVGEGDSIKVGRPYLQGCNVSATVVSQGRHKKIHVVKFRRRKHHEKWQGHRQNYTEVKITQITA